MEEYPVRVVGRLLSADLDGEGTVHIILGKDDPNWAATAVRMLRLYTGRVVVVGVRPWLRKRSTHPCENTLGGKTRRHHVSEKLPIRS